MADLKQKKARTSQGSGLFNFIKQKVRLLQMRARPEEVGTLP